MEYTSVWVVRKGPPSVIMMIGVEFIMLIIMFVQVMKKIVGIMKGS